jgi:hypothetical protein
MSIFIDQGGPNMSIFIDQGGPNMPMAKVKAKNAYEKRNGGNWIQNIWVV